MHFLIKYGFCCGCYFGDESGGNSAGSGVIYIPSDPNDGIIGGGGGSGSGKHNPPSSGQPDNDNDNNDDQVDKQDDCLKAGGCDATTPVFKLGDDEDDEPEDGCQTSVEDLQEVFPNANTDLLQVVADAINNYSKVFGIDTDAKLQNFLAQAAVETGDFSTLNVTENLNYSTASLIPINYSKFTMDTIAEPNKYYAGDYLHDQERLANVAYCCKNGNGSVESGDGWRYRGRGIFQLTWKDNYDGYENFLNNHPEIEATYNSPDDISSGLNAVLSGMWFYKTKILDRRNINDQTSADVSTKIINYNTDSYKQRRTKLTDVKQDIKCK